MIYINNTLPRHDIPISNSFEIINHINDDFHIVIYYINNYKYKIIIRRLDSYDGWGQNICIKINSNNKIISLGSSEKNCKIIYIYLDYVLDKVIYDIQKIPKVIIQTTKNKNITNMLLYNAVQTFLELNPEYTYLLFDDYECRKFIKENFQLDVLIAYDLLIPGAFKADLFRYCYLYINGGCYFDFKNIIRFPIRNVIKKNDSLLLCLDGDKESYYNAIILSEKKNDLLLKTINLCKNKIYNINKFYNFINKDINKAKYILSLTGPKLFYEAISNIINKKEIVIFNHIQIKDFHEYKRLIVEYNNHTFITKSYQNFESTGIHYSTLWFRREILYKNFIILNNYKIYVYAHDFNDLYNFYIFNNNTLIIERYDINSGWGNNLKIKIINEDNDLEEMIEIGNSDNKYKKFIFNNNFLENYNLINNFIYKSDQANDIFDVSIIKNLSYYYILIIRKDTDTGWSQNLIINTQIYDKNYEISIGESNTNIFIKNINI